MARHSRTVRALLFVAAFSPAIHAEAAHAGDISFISTAGSDANACTLAAPCRTLRHAIKVTSERGEIRILDSGFFGRNATINKSLTINGNGNSVLLGTDLLVDRTGETDLRVVVRNLALNGQGARLFGIRIITRAKVHIERCVFHGFLNDGISIQDPGAEVFVVDSIARDNARAGLFVRDGIVRISNSTFTDNVVGIDNSGTVETRQNNTLRGNGAEVNGGPLTPFAGL